MTLVLTNSAKKFPSRVDCWRLRTMELMLPARPLLMGIVNITPDSFSDGGLFFDSNSAILHGQALAAAGADLLDVGGESTRPYSTPVSAEEELHRTIDVVAALVKSTGKPVSIDTSKAIVAEAALAAGAEIINDITALAGDSRMVEVALASRAAVVAMHMQGAPQTMQDAPLYDDVIREVFELLRGRRDALEAAGVSREQICLDPGIGFGKTHQHNLTLTANCWRLHDLGCPLLVGHSRKGFIGKVLGDKNAGKTTGTIGVACSLAQQGVQILRIHDVAAVREALLLFEATGGLDGHPLDVSKKG